MCIGIILGAVLISSYERVMLQSLDDAISSDIQTEMQTVFFSLGIHTFSLVA